jgi:hypothetical protein
MARNQYLVVSPGSAAHGSDIVPWVARCRRYNPNPSEALIMYPAIIQGQRFQNSKYKSTKGKAVM